MNIAFIGGGNMAGALIGGLLQKGSSAAHIRVAEISAEARAGLSARFGVTAAADLAPVVSGSDVVVLAVKPQQLCETAKQAAPLLQAQTVVSIAAGIRCADISRWLGGYQRLVRAMPNMPALVGAGISGLFAMPAVGEEEKRRAETILGAAGETLWLEREEQLDAITAVSGSGPAYVFYFIEALAAAAAEQGFTAQQARQLSLATFLGAARLASRSEEDAGVLRERVTSPGGTTERALAAMERDGVKRHIIAAVHAAAQRARELGDEFGRQE